MNVDEYREAILEARENGAPVSAIARTLGFPPSTVQHALMRWERPARPRPGEDALVALKRLVDS